jgi:hypothetical protein
VISTPDPNGDSTHEAVQGPDVDADDERCLMAELSIVQGGRHYFYDGYRYDSLADAVFHAQLIQGRRTRRPGSPATS